MLQLLVELLAQPAQLLRVAKLLGVDLFVMGAGEGVVGGAVVFRRRGAALLRPGRGFLGFGVAIVEIAVRIGLLLRALGLGRFRLGGKHGLLLALGLALAFPRVVLLRAV